MGKILVTGGLGFIGSHTTAALLQAGHDVVVADDLSNSRREVASAIAQLTGKDVTFEEVNLTQSQAVDALFAKHGPLDGIIHFAAFKAVGESVAKPLEYYHNNLVSLINLLLVARNHGCKNIIFSSSCTVYGQAEQLPVAEDAPVQPAESPYGNTKQMGEEILRDAALADGFRVISLRYFNPIGAHPTALIGELPLGVPQNLVPFITQTAAGIRKELSVFGSDYPTRDGTAIRDYIHVVDLAEAHMAALNHLMNGVQTTPFEVFNVGTGKGTTVLEALQAFERATGVAVPHRLVDRRPGDVVEAWADTTRIEQTLHWKATRSLDEAMADAWRWQQSLG
jgi:UDP-glucose 4-epimerase